MHTAADAGTQSRPFTVESETERLTRMFGELQGQAYRTGPAPDFLFDPRTGTLHDGRARTSTTTPAT